MASPWCGGVTSVYAKSYGKLKHTQSLLENCENTYGECRYHFALIWRQSNLRPWCSIIYHVYLFFVPLCLRWNSHSGIPANNAPPLLSRSSQICHAMPVGIQCIFCSAANSPSASLTSSCLFVGAVRSLMWFIGLDCKTSSNSLPHCNH